MLKVQFPHLEREHEAEALRCWNGQGAVRLFDHDPIHHALLIERCEPGNPLSCSTADEAMEVFAGLLPRLWISADKPFRALRDESIGWAEHLPSSWERAGRAFEMELLSAALQALDRLRETQGKQVLVHQTGTMCCEPSVSPGSSSIQNLLLVSESLVSLQSFGPTNSAIAEQLQ